MVRLDQPPRAPTEAIARPRLRDALEQRFEVALTLVVGGGGVGKTTLLAQCLTDQPDRVDVWLTAVEADDPERLLARALLALGRPDEVADVDRVAEAIVSMAPRQVCLVVDDAHRLPDPAVLGDLVDRLPRNGHVLVGSRRRPALDLARLAAAGDLVEIDQSDLLFTDDELREVARLRRVDISQLVEAAGWPAFVELAMRGEGARGRAYLEEEALARIDPDRALDVARFGFVGGGDDELARAVTGRGLDELLHGLPLVIGDLRSEARPHDLWLEVLDDQLHADDRRHAAEAAATVLAERGDLDSAIELTARVGSAEAFLGFVRTACLSILDGGLRPDRLARWTAQVPASLADRGVAHLVRGLLERERDPYDPVCWDAFEAAAAAFAVEGDTDGEIAALAQLGYLAQWVDREDHLLVLMGRMGELAAAGVAAAEPFLKFGEAWLHFAGGDPDAQLKAVEPIDPDSVPYAWRLIREYLRANAVMGLGRPDEALELIPTVLRDRTAPLPGALTIEDQVEWLAGRPEVVFQRGATGGSADYGSRDRFMAGIWETQMYSYAGRRDEAVAALESARVAAGPEPGPVIQFQLMALGTLPDLAAGEEERPAQVLREMLAMVPLETPMMKGFLQRYVPLVYVLMPESRSFWTETSLGPCFAAGRSFAEVLVAYRDDGELGPARLLRWPEPGVAASMLPVPWLVEFALIGGAAGVPGAQPMAAWACEHWGVPAREALRRWAAGDTPLADVASQWLVEIPMPPEDPAQISLLGSMQLRHGGSPSTHAAWRRERVRSLLLFLILHGPAARDAVADALWPDLDPTKADKNLRTTLNYLHQALEPMRSAREAPWYVRNDQGMLSVHPSLDVDLRRVDELLDRAADLDRAGSSIAALETYMEALPLWRGDLASGEADHSWADLERTRLRSRLVRGAARAGDLLVAQGRPEEAIAVCHQAIDADRWSEPAYAALTRAYLELDDVTSARRTVTAAETALGEIEVELSYEVRRLVPGSTR